LGGRRGDVIEEIMTSKLKRRFRVTSALWFLRNPISPVAEHVAKAFGEDWRKHAVLVFGRVRGPADGAGLVPDQGFERFPIPVFLMLSFQKP